MELSEFLLARIAEDEDQADQNAAVFSGFLNGSRSRGQLECEAKRRIVDQCRWIEDELREEAGWVPSAVDDILKALALPYADHPDYNPVWRL